MNQQTAAGLGSGALTGWAWDALLVPQLGLEPMPAAISPIVGGALYTLFIYIAAWLPRPGESALERVKRELERR